MGLHFSASTIPPFLLVLIKMEKGEVIIDVALSTSPHCSNLKQISNCDVEKNNKLKYHRQG